MVIYHIKVPDKIKKVICLTTHNLLFDNSKNKFIYEFLTISVKSDQSSTLNALISRTLLLNHRILDNLLMARYTLVKVSFSDTLI